MNRIKMALIRFMTGRYGLDELGKFILYSSLIVIIISMFFRLNILYMIGLIILVYAYYRLLSKNVQKRYAENQKFLNLKNKIFSRSKDFKTHVIFKCPNCKQKIRVPRGKGKICIKCPKCRIEFIKKT